MGGEGEGASSERIDQPIAVGEEDEDVSPENLLAEYRDRAETAESMLVEAQRELAVVKKAHAEEISWRDTYIVELERKLEVAQESS